MGMIEHLFISLLFMAGIAGIVLMLTLIYEIFMED
jgi:hypothetical protein